MSSRSISHLIDLASRFVYLGFAVNYVLYPPTKPHISISRFEHITFRECFIYLFSISFIIQGLSYSKFPFIMVLFAFGSCLPSVPFPNNLSFDVLLWAIFIYILQLHFPFFPSPFFALLPERNIPLGVLIHDRIAQIVYPAFMFFFPALLFSFFLLSYSLSDLAPGPSTLAPAAMQTRFTFFTLVVAILALMIFTSFALVTSSFSPPPPPSSSPWDRYSPRIGQIARRKFYRALLFYSKPYTYPPPLNVACSLLRVLGKFTGRWDTSLVEKYLWRILVGPLVVLATFFISAGDKMLLLLFQ
ncbi:hypothetical protein BD779DRAFT_1484450 [Infundibulicybe gibba]|nr:hypothetical protein BD779DRAFT_1484450 [Infundibulicybe gibba]